MLPGTAGGRFSTDMDALEEAIGRHLAARDFATAATAIVRGYGPEILGYLVALARDPDRAQDAFSQCCEDLWRGLPGFRGDSSARTWMYRLAWHAWLRHERRPFPRRAVGLDSAELSLLAAEVRTTTAPYLRTDVKDAVAQLRERLGSAERSLLVLRVDRALTWSEIATVMSTAEKTVDGQTLAKRFERVKAKLRRLAEEAGLLDRE
jgi:RNA polymerase sigma-70 factor, ECF subfamily